jgi:hypothetical protein
MWSYPLPHQKLQDDAPYVGVAGREGPERVVGIIGDFHHGPDEAVERWTQETVHLFECPAAQFGPVSHWAIAVRLHTWRKRRNCW